MAMHAHPVPTDPYSPLPSTSSRTVHDPSTVSNAEEFIRHPSPFIPIRLPIFAVVIWLNDWIVRIISVGGGAGGKAGGGPRIVRQKRTMSDGFENAEEGIELGTAIGSRGGRIGGRRKID